MKKQRGIGIAALAAMGLIGGIPFHPGPTDRTPYPWEVEPPKGPPRQPEVGEMSKKARKAYARVMRETQDREKALKAAMEVEEG